MAYKAGNFQGSLQNENVEPFFENSQSKQCQQRSNPWNQAWGLLSLGPSTVTLGVGLVTCLPSGYLPWLLSHLGSLVSFISQKDILLLKSKQYSLWNYQSDYFIYAINCIPTHFPYPPQRGKISSKRMISSSDSKEFKIPVNTLNPTMMKIPQKSHWNTSLIHYCWFSKSPTFSICLSVCLK